MTDDREDETQFVPVEVLDAIDRLANGEQTTTKEDLADALKF